MQSHVEYNRLALFALSLATAALAACTGGGSSGGGGSAPPVAAPPPPPPPTPMSETDVIYGSGLTDTGAINLLLDIYQPGGVCTDPRPFVVGIHGGGFTGGSKGDSNWVGIAEDLTARGYVVMSIDYRLVRDEPDVSAEFEPLLADFLDEANNQQVDADGLRQINAAAAAVEDTVAALRWARENAATRCLDIDRFAIAGSSAGGYTSVHTSYLLNTYNIDVPQADVTIDLWGGSFLRGQIDDGEPPLMIVHGTNDATVSYDQAQFLQQDAEAVSLPLAFYTIEGGGHGFGIINPDRVQVDGLSLYDVMYNFIDAHLLEGGAPVYEVRNIVPTP